MTQIKEKVFQQFIEIIIPGLGFPPPEELKESLREFFNMGWQSGALFNRASQELAASQPTLRLCSWEAGTLLAFDEWWSSVAPGATTLPDWFVKLMRLAALCGWKAVQQGVEL